LTLGNSVVLFFRDFGDSFEELGGEAGFIAPDESL